MDPDASAPPGVHYRTNRAIDQACREVITLIASCCTEIFLIQQESREDRLSSMIRFKLIHRKWGPVACIRLKYLDPTQTLILLELPPEPGLEESKGYLPAIMELGPAENAAVRLAHVKGSEQHMLLRVKELLQEKRFTYTMRLQSWLVHFLQLVYCERPPEETARDIPKGNGRPSQDDRNPTPVEEKLLKLWTQGLTARQIALRMDRTEKTILNRLTLLRKAYGEQMVPRRRMT
jgi:hypothetical protein